MTDVKVGYCAHLLFPPFVADLWRIPTEKKLLVHDYNVDDDDDVDDDPSPSLSLHIFLVIIGDKAEKGEDRIESK